MDDIQLLISQANESLANGNVREAYHTYLQALEFATKELHSVKFVHNAITSKPPSIDTILLLIQNCLKSTQDILSRAVETNAITPPLPVPPRGRTSTSAFLAVHSPGPSTVIDEDDGASVASDRSMGSTKSVPPPIPPKPLRMKPPIPPKPARSLPLPTNIPDRKHVGEANTNIISGKIPVEIEQVQEQKLMYGQEMEDEDERTVVDELDHEITEEREEGNEEREELYEEEEEYQDLQDSSTGRRYARRPESEPFSAPKRVSSPINSSGSISPSRRPPNDTSLSPSMFHKTPSSSLPSSATLSKSNFPPSFITVVAEGEIDPTQLQPAQTSNGDSLAPPNSPSTVSITDHVPLIPIPPLLTSHRNYETKLNQNEAKLTEYRSMKRAQELPGEDGRPSSAQSLSMETIDDAITKYLTTVASTKETLNRLRTLYMTAATVPSITQFPPHLIAYQLTLIEQAIFREIPPTALLEHSPRHPHPQIVASTDFFNYLTRLIEHSILLPQETTLRAQHIHHWIKAASKCHELQNYQTLKAIVCALGTPPVERLKRTWACIPRKSMQKLEMLSELMSEARNYGKYREHMGMQASANVRGLSISVMRHETLKKPTVPFLGTFMHDITYLLAAVKSGNTLSTASLSSVSSSSGSVYVNRDSRDSGVSSLKDEAIGVYTTTIAPPSPTAMQPQDDSRVQDLLTTFKYYQSGPKYAPAPPSNYLKGSHKSHFRVGSGSLTNALHRSASKTASSTFMNVVKGYGNDDDEGTIESQQQMITHYLLTRTWVGEKIVDELSSLREPPKRRMDSIGSGPRASSGTTTSGAYTASMVSNASSFYGGRTSISSGVGPSGGSSGSGNDSRPNSVDVETFATSGPASAPQLSRRSLSNEGIDPQPSAAIAGMSLSSSSSSGTQKEKKLFGWLPGRSSIDGKRPASAGNLVGGTGGNNRNSVADEILEDSDDEEDEEAVIADEISIRGQHAKDNRQSWRVSGIRVLPDGGIGNANLLSADRLLSSSTPEVATSPSVTLPKPPTIPSHTRDRSPSEGSPRAPPRNHFLSPSPSPNSSTSTVSQTSVRHSFDMDYARPSAPTAALPPPPLAPKPKNVLKKMGSGQNLAVGMTQTI